MSAIPELSDFVFILDQDGRVIHANDGFLEAWNCPRESALGRKFSDFLDNPEVGAMLDRQVRQVLASGRGTKDVVFYVRPNGLSLEYEYVFEAFRAADGKLSGVVGSTRNVTERNRAGTHVAFTTALGDRLAQSTSPAEIMQIATREVGRQLAADRCYICEWDPSLDHCEVLSDWTMEEAPSLVGSYQLSNYGPRAWWELLTAGNVSIQDVRQHDLAKDFLPAYDALGIRAYATARFRRDNDGVATLVVTTRERRAWLREELTLLENVIARTWPLIEHAREESNAQFLRSMTERMSVLTEANEISRLAVYSLGQHVQAHRCYFFEQIPGDPNTVLVMEDWHPAGATSVAGEHRIDDFGGPEFWETVRNGSAEVGDVRQDPRLNAAAFEALGTRSYITVPFRRDGRWIAALAVTSDHPRKWKRSEFQLVENTLARVWPAIERARINSDLRQSVERLHLAFAAAKLGDFQWEAATDRMILSPRAEEIYDVAPGQSISRTAMRQKLHPNDREVARQANEHALASHTHYEIEYRLALPDGHWRWVAATGRGIYDAEGNGIGMRGVVQDITARKEAEEKLREQETLLRAHAAELEARVAERTASLQEMVTQMEEFSYSVSHDLRGPLRTMQGYAQILSEDYGAQLDDVAQNYLSRIQRSCTRMEKLTHDVLTYSRVSRSEIATESIDLSKLVHDLINQYAQLQAPNCDLQIRESLLHVRGHEPSLGQAISNLLLNAVKFVEPKILPRIEISTEQRGPSVRLWIKDNGIGIPPDQQRHLFKIFERLPTNGSYEGTGIGLAIVRRAVEKMNGTYGVDSDGVNGSQFWIELPAN